MIVGAFTTIICHARIMPKMPKNNVRPFRISALSTLYMRLPARAMVVMSALFESPICTLDCLPGWVDVRPFRAYVLSCSQSWGGEVRSFQISVLSILCLFLKWGSDVRPFQISVL